MELNLGARTSSSAPEREARIICASDDASADEDVRAPSEELDTPAIGNRQYF